MAQRLPTVDPPRRSAAGWIAAGCGAIALALYGATLAPTVSVEDTGELIAAAYSLGIPHPTGYPLWTLLAAAFVHGLPFGNDLDPIAWRANFLSACCGAATVGLVAWLVLRATGRRTPAIAAALALAGSRELWEQSVIAEVYTLNALGFVVAIALAWRWHETRRSTPLYALALALGLGMCNHSTMVLVTPVFVAWVVGTAGFSAEAWRRYAVAGLLVCVGLAVHLYLPLRARAHPAMNWGDPSDWRGFLDVVTRAQYHGLIAEHPRSVGRFLVQLRAFLATAVWEFGPWVAWLAPLGALALLRRSRWLGGLVLALFAVVLAGSLLVPNFDTDRQGLWNYSPFFIPLYVLAAIWIGAALATASARLGPVPGSALGLVVALSPVVLHYRVNDMSDYTIVRDYALDVFDTLAPNAVYLGVGDHRLFPLRYLQIVHGVRPDVLIANPYGYVPPEVLAEVPDRVRRDFHPRPTASEEARLLRWFLVEAERPLYTSVPRPIPGARAVAEGLVQRHVRLGSHASTPAPSPAPRGSGARALSIPDDWTAEQVAFDYLTAEGRALLAQGRTQEGIARWRAAIPVAHDDASLLTNLAAEAGAAHQLNLAVEILLRVREQHPRHLPARLNLVRAYVAGGRFAKAAEELDALEREFPDSRRVAQLTAWAGDAGVRISPRSRSPRAPSGAQRAPPRG